MRHVTKTLLDCLLYSKGPLSPITNTDSAEQGFMLSCIHSCLKKNLTILIIIKKNQKCKVLKNKSKKHIETEKCLRPKTKVKIMVVALCLAVC